jgi:hypothetical protein
MIYFSENNWVGWKYDNGPLYARSVSPYEKYTLSYKQTEEEIGSLWHESIKAAKSTRDHYPNLKPSLFFSGGLDSEVMVRAFVEAGIDFNLYTVRYNNDYNIYDVSYAVTISNILGLDLKIIDMDLEKFFENEAETISEQAQCDRPRMLPQMKFADYVDGLPILSMADITWQRNSNNYSKKGTWNAWEVESDSACDKYNLYHNRTAIYQWARWSPGMLLAHTKWNWFHKLVNDKIYGKLGNSSTKMQGFLEEFPDMIPRQKKIGFESCENIISEFEGFLEKKYNGLPYRRIYSQSLDEIWTNITGKPFNAANNA